MGHDPIAFIDLAAQQKVLQPEIDQAIKTVLEHGQYIMGPEVHMLEEKLAQYCGAHHAISCANGTDALVLSLKALNIGPGDAVFVPAFTFIATAEAVVNAGATPVFVDVDENTFNMSVTSLHNAIESIAKTKLKPRCIIPVDLFGQPADYDAINKIASEFDLYVLADGAQSFGASIGDKKVGQLAPITTTSFFPAKPLGCYGDGGAIFTNDEVLANKLRSLRVHGKGLHKYDNVSVGFNSRLDTIQAAILLVKLKAFPKEIAERQSIAKIYSSALAEKFEVPNSLAEYQSAWAQYTLKTDQRAGLIERAKAAGIPLQVYYPIALHQQKGYDAYPIAPSGCGVAQKLSQCVVSLPMHPYLSSVDQERVIAFLSH
ncbi:UDP-2-acetamido-2-deoxy-3-oxo-D-glucuronate aminotransferase [Candidatus Terasakiella magnetica]|uniref:UDP-2-acetamido-2-deoxy-3-oxo-D-glucuronate aminotransferase n=1 Tax=Candidatus Terasakiella magnetica TaxID=1867952 RepID=A0A1C3RG85_9PROT|nr:DegT/DnrJ/EryC1/StrS family aminotransferase [Candidatus Terasakiella magnetica]SCA56212.1 UDP-2-acetamido-2-deoxy-3-oxo-D-glucuronate aminotransferase [Candidatus Terasakiella magnetica]